VKKFFLLESGDFIGTFLSMSKQELEKGRGEISLLSLRTNLELAIRSSVLKVDYDLFFFLCCADYLDRMICMLRK